MVCNNILTCQRIPLCHGKGYPDFNLISRNEDLIACEEDNDKEGNAADESCLTADSNNFDACRLFFSLSLRISSALRAFDSDFHNNQISPLPNSSLPKNNEKWNLES